MSIFEFAVCFYILNYYLENYHTVHQNFKDPFIILHDKLFPLKLGVYIKKEDVKKKKSTFPNWYSSNLEPTIIIKERESYLEYICDYPNENNELREVIYTRKTIVDNYIYSNSNLIGDILK